jgi:hypothetical protein
MLFKRKQNKMKFLHFVFQLSFPAMLKKKRPQEYKLRAFVGILFLSVVFLVGFAYVFYHQQVLQVILCVHARVRTHTHFIHIHTSSYIVLDILSLKCSMKEILRL